MSSRRRPPTREAALAAQPKVGLVEELARWFESQPNARERFAWVLRDSLDELLNGQRTGRWCYQHLRKGEKTHLGTVIEINLSNEFAEIQDGQDIDWNIDGQEVDCKFSKDFGGWEIPMEMYRCSGHGEVQGTDNHLALLLWMNDDDSQWAAGVAQIHDHLLKFKADGSRQYNRDNKRRLNDGGLESIRWLWGGLQDDLPANLLLQMDAEKRSVILSPNSGQQRVNALLREVQGTIIPRSTVLTVAQQDDAMKRPRDARLPRHVGDEGYLVLGHQDADPHRTMSRPARPDEGRIRVLPGCSRPDSVSTQGLAGRRVVAARRRQRSRVRRSRPKPVSQAGLSVDRIRTPGRRRTDAGVTGPQLERHLGASRR